MSDATQKARDWCNAVRRNPSPLADAIPMVQRLCDDYDALAARLAEAQANEGAWEATAQHHYKEARAAETRLAEVQQLLREAAGKALLLLDYADDSDDCQYGTISTGTVRELLADLRRLLGEAGHRCDAPGCDHWERHGRACETCAARREP